MNTTGMRLGMLVTILLFVAFVPSDASSAQSPDTVVRKLYAQVLAYKPLGIPKGAAKAAIWPLLSKTLVRELNAAQSCENDYFRQHAARDGKPEFGWLESGLFSGENEQATPSSATVEQTYPQKGRSFPSTSDLQIEIRTNGMSM